MNTKELKVKENGLRNRAERQGMKLRKSRRMDPKALGYGTYGLDDAFGHGLVFGDPRTGHGLTLEEIDVILTLGRESALKKQPTQHAGEDS